MLLCAVVKCLSTLLIPVPNVANPSENARTRRFQQNTYSFQKASPDLLLARLNIFGETSFEERQCEVERMRYMKNLFRGGAT
ncbi:hypothetical protein EDB87DRAFT_114980 [Lactarius vividus]|nr:hypothetical protein EDB87DRAFT_114980 [Lactarius vividus]